MPEGGWLESIDVADFALGRLYDDGVWVTLVRRLGPQYNDISDRQLGIRK